MPVTSTSDTLTGQAATLPPALDAALIERATAHLRAADPVLARAIDAAGPCRLGRAPDLFAALVDAIISQQLSIKAAATILDRLKALYAPAPFPAPADLLATPDERLRAAGCSRAKVVSLKDLCARLAGGTLDLEPLRRLPDDEVVRALVAVKGIGRWTAEMVLIFALGRPDVWPVDDLGLVSAVQGLYALPARPARPALLALGERWRPYRTVASWYLWQSRRLVLGMPW
jgi:DNA-3-methyladenine glycosylase II